MKREKVLVLVILLFTIGLYAQNETTKISRDTINTKEGLKKYAVQYYFDDIETNIGKNTPRYVNDKVMNIFFADEVSSYISDSKDLSLQKAYAVLSTADKTLFIGTSLDFCRSNKTEKLSNLLTIGFKAKVKDDFTTVFKDDKGQNNIGFNVKYTWVGRGILNFGENAKVIKKYRDEILKEEFQKKTNKYLSDKEGESELKKKEILDKLVVDSKKHKKKKESIYTAKAIDVYTKLAEAETELIRKHKMYNWFWNHYTVFELYAPITRKSYTMLTDVNTSSTENEYTYPWKVLAGYTSFWKKSKGQAFYLSGSISAFNNNNAQIESIKPFDLQTPHTTNPNLIKETNKVYIEDLEEFVTTNVKLEAVSYLFNKGMFGVSMAVEQNFGDYDTLNWKLGVPVSLKDKEGKPNVNFELQWKEVNGHHFVGIGVGLAFGKYLK